MVLYEFKTGNSLKDNEADEALKTALVRQTCFWGLIRMLEEREKVGNEEVLVDISEVTGTSSGGGTDAWAGLDPIKEEGEDT